MGTNSKLLENTRNYRKTKKGLLTNIFHKMKYRRGVEFSLQEFHNLFLEDRKYNRLHNEWVKSGFEKQFIPSIDRINFKNGYTIDNIHILTWAENRFKQTMERRNRKGAVLQMLGNKIIKKYISQRQAVIETGLSQSNMSAVLNGKKKTCGGYIWKYENPELLTNP